MTKKIDDPAKRRDWAFTDFNLENQTKYASLVEQCVCTYVCYGIEYAPTTGKAHLQGYLHFKNPRTTREGRTVFGKTHSEFCWHSRDKNIEYCKKGTKILGETFFEFGKKPNQGYRTDIENVEYILKTTRSLQDVIDNHFNLYIQYRSRFLNYLEDTEKPRTEMTKGIWYHGPAGCGKSTYIKNNFFGTEVVWLEYDGKFFSDYNGHKTVIFDDQDISKFSRSVILKLLNHTPFKLRCLGSYREFNADRVIFIDNFHYSHYFGEDEAIARRLKAIDFGTEVPK